MNWSGMALDRREGHLIPGPYTEVRSPGSRAPCARLYEGSCSSGVVLRPESGNKAQVGERVSAGEFCARSPEVEPLHEVHAQVAQDLDGEGILYMLGDHGLVEVVRNCDHRRHKETIAGVRM